MSNTSKKIVSTIGIVIGVIIIIIGFSLQDTSNYSIGESIKFGADFYTEMYDVTKDVGRAINYAINDLICAISWLIISLGAIDICFFVYKLVKASEVSAIEVKAKVQTEEHAGREGAKKVISPRTHEISSNNTNDSTKKEHTKKEEPQNILLCHECGEDLSFMGWDDNELKEEQTCPLCGKEILFKQ